MSIDRKAFVCQVARLERRSPTRLLTCAIAGCCNHPDHDGCRLLWLSQDFSLKSHPTITVSQIVSGLAEAVAAISVSNTGMRRRI